MGISNDKEKGAKKQFLPNSLYIYILHLADAFIQSDLHMCDLQCIHIYIYTDGTLHIRSN